MIKKSLVLIVTITVFLLPSTLFASTLSTVESFIPNDELSVLMDERNNELLEYLKKGYDQNIDFGTIGQKFFEEHSEYNFIENLYRDNTLYTDYNSDADQEVLYRKDLVDEKQISADGTMENVDVDVVFYSDGSYLIDTLTYGKISDTSQNFAILNSQAFGQNIHEKRSFNGALIFRTYLEARFNYNGQNAYCTHKAGNSRPGVNIYAVKNLPVETFPPSAPYYGKLSRINMWTEFYYYNSNIQIGLDNIKISCGPDGTIYKNNLDEY